MQPAQESALLAGLVAADTFDAQLDAIADACPLGIDGRRWDESTHEALTGVAQLLRLAASSGGSIALPQHAAAGSEGHDGPPVLLGVELVVVHAAEQALTQRVCRLNLNVYLCNDVCPACIAVFATTLCDCVSRAIICIVPYLGEAFAKRLQHLLKQQPGPSNERPLV